MDVLKPDIFVIEGINYRINPGFETDDKEGPSGQFDEQSIDHYNDTPSFEALSDGDEDIEELSVGRYKVSFHVPKSYFSYIIGSKGSTKKRLETETCSRINIPKQGQSGDVVITAATKKNVATARRRILLMVLSSRKRRPPTHFISVPLNKPSLINGLMNFKNEILQKFGRNAGICEELFQSPERLHLTVGLLALSDESERQEAAEVLNECKDTVIRPLLSDRELCIEMNGIDIMNDDPSSVRVLYGNVKACNDDYLLQELVDGILTFFSKKGLLVREKGNHVKLHCTLMNTKFLKSSDDEVDAADSSAPDGTFDASDIIKNYKEYYFGNDIISTIELSTFHTSTRDSYYKSSSFITIS